MANEAPFFNPSFTNYASNLGDINSLVSSSKSTPLFPSAPATEAPAPVTNEVAEATVSGTTKVTVTEAQPTRGVTPAPTEDKFKNPSDIYRNGNGGGMFDRSRVLGEDVEDDISYLTLFENNGGGKEIVSSYSRFFLQNVAEADQEKYQVIETFAGFYAFFYGKRPAVYRYSGLLLSDVNFRWNNDFKFMYENYFRGTKAVERNAQVLIYHDSRLVTGFPLSFSAQQGADLTKGMPFSMDVLVVDHIPIKFSVDAAALLAREQSKLADSAERIKQYMNHIKKRPSPELVKMLEGLKRGQPPVVMELSARGNIA
jgi:hypothetical protein